MLKPICLFLPLVLCTGLAAQSATLIDCKAQVAAIGDRCVAQNQQRFDVACAVVKAMSAIGYQGVAVAHANRVCAQLEQHTTICNAAMQRLCDRCVEKLSPAEAIHLRKQCSLSQMFTSSHSSSLCAKLRARACGRRR